MSILAPPARAVPVLDLGPETEALWDELTAAIHKVLRSGHFILGAEVKAFEAEVAAYLGVKHAVALNSGTDALVIGLRALGVGPGDEVVTTPFTFFATAEAVSLLGATPVFVDIEPDTLNLDVRQLEAAVTPRTKAIVPVHVFGQACDMDGVMEVAARHGVPVLEDCAQCFGADHRGRRAGTLGAAAAWSFFPSKNLGAFGDGGMLTTDDDVLAGEARMLRAHGSRVKYHNEAIGYNSRLDELQAAILRVKLPHVDAANEGRRRVAARYAELFADVPGVTVPAERPWATHVYHQYTIRVADGRRDAVQQALAAEGIGTMIYYPVPLHHLPVYAAMGCSLPEAERAAGEVISLPITPTLSEGDQRRVVDAVAAAVAGRVGG
jgi:dTDP-4-amino-4,6-dideoxygalactose transaminase